MSIRTLSERFGYVAAFDEISGRLVYIARRLAEDKDYLQRKGLVIIETGKDEKQDLTKQK